MGVNLGDRLACAYHGIEIRDDGVVTKVPGSPGCKLEGSKATRSFPVQEHNGVIFAFNATEPNLQTPPALNLPPELTSDEWSSFLCYT